MLSSRSESALGQSYLPQVTKATPVRVQYVKTREPVTEPVSQQVNEINDTFVEKVQRQLLKAEAMLSNCALAKAEL